MSHEMDLFLDHISSKRDMGPRYWHNFLENGWCFPAFQKQKGKALHELFSRRRSLEQYKKVEARSSELLSLYALVRHGVEKHVARGPDVDAHLDSCLAACRVIDTIQLAKHQVLPMNVAAVRFRAAHSEHMKRTQRVYGTNHIKPKSHCML